VELQKAKRILDQFPRDGSSESKNDQIVLEASDEAIMLAQQLAMENYARDHPSEVKVERRGPLREMLAWLKEGVVKKQQKKLVHGTVMPVNQV
jgi:hypothetical protein